MCLTFNQQLLDSRLQQSQVHFSKIFLVNIRNQMWLLFFYYFLNRTQIIVSHLNGKSKVGWNQKTQMKSRAVQLIFRPKLLRLWSKQLLYCFLHGNLMRQFSVWMVKNISIFKKLIKMQIFPCIYIYLIFNESQKCQPFQKMDQNANILIYILQIFNKSCTIGLLHVSVIIRLTTCWTCLLFKSSAL
eukprot:TRINITY_DN3785_c0_g1_i8.p1 TRINITY_DN3785_c0_g1~~TRINITY_DN3785_c0_g1_i8.p1  ORF type:complete len:187 (+),score=-11.42 TRINITY_DN3785_c0_g1_i8:292-852(+)